MSSSNRGQSFNIIGNSNTIGNIFTTGGNVGINTSAPTYKLDVNGIIHIGVNSPGSNNGSLYIDNLSSRTSIQSWFYSATSKGNLSIGQNVYWDASGNYTLYNTAGSAWSMVMGSANDSFNIARYNTSGSSLIPLTITSSGNLGVSTASPAYTLDIAGTTLFRNGNNSGVFTNNQQLFGFSNTATYMHAIKTRHNAGANDSNNAIDICIWQTSDSVSAVGSKNVMSITSVGIGIGTTSPSVKLDMGPNASSQLLAIYNSPGTANAYYGFGAANNNLNYMAGFNHQFYVNSGYGTLGTAALTITSSGNLGVNTASPTHALHINDTSSDPFSLWIDGSSKTTNTGIDINASASYTPFINFHKNGSGIGIVAADTTSISVVGKLGVNISTVPAYTLDVAGTGRFTSSLTIGTGNTSNWANQTISSNVNFPMIFCATRGNIASFLFTSADANTAYLNINNANGNMLDVAGTIARSGVKLPRFDNGTFSGASTAVIPILFSDTQYNYVEIKIRFQVSTACNVVFSGNSTNAGNGTALGLGENAETTVKNNAQGTPVYTSSGYIAQNCEQLTIDNICTIRMIRATSGSQPRNHYTFETVYCWSGIGATRVSGFGYINGLTFGSVILTTSAGTISGTYSTQHSY